MRRIIREFKKHSKGFSFRIGLLFLISILSGGISLVSPQISGRLVDVLVEVKLEREIYRYALIFLLISLLRMLLSFISERLFLFLNTRISYRLAEQVTSYLQDLPQGFFHRKNSVHLAKNIETDAWIVFESKLSYRHRPLYNGPFVKTTSAKNIVNGFGVAWPAGLPTPVAVVAVVL
ncbi:MAG: ABC transporter ATP-binding protein [Lachnospiraceae bacterium]|nr:ABC transporter ATP-binding protein [Lachnospiraceae bacterium]